MRAYTHGSGAHRQRVSTTFSSDSEKLSQIFLVLRTGFEPLVMESIGSRGRRSTSWATTSLRSLNHASFSVSLSFSLTFLEKSPKYSITTFSKLNLCEGGSFSPSIFNSDIELSVYTTFCVLHLFVRSSLCRRVKLAKYVHIVLSSPYDPVVHVRVWWIMETRKDPASTLIS